MPRAYLLQGRSFSAVGGEACSDSLELERGSTPVRCVRPRLAHGHHGRAEPAQDAYLAALVGLLAPSNLTVLQ
jgi:hypothetical protein